MATPSHNHKRSGFFNILPSIGFGLTSFLGVFSFSSEKILKNSKIPSVSKELTPFILALTSVTALYLHNRSLRQLGEKDKEIASLAKPLTSSLPSISPEEIARLKEIEQKYIQQQKELIPLLIQAYSLMQILSDQVIPEDTITQNVPSYFKALPENLRNFKIFVQELQEERVQLLGEDESYSEVVFKFAKELQASSKDKVSFLLAKETKEVIDLIKSIYDMFSLLSDDAAPSQEDIEANPAIYLAALPTSIAAFKAFIQELQKDLQNDPSSQAEFHKSVQASVERLKTASRNSTPTRPVARTLELSSAPSTPLKSKTSSQQQ